MLSDMWEKEEWFTEMGVELVEGDMWGMIRKDGLLLKMTSDDFAVDADGKHPDICVIS